MKGIKAGALAVAAALMLLLLDVHIARTSDKVDAQQTVSRQQAGAAASGQTLRVFITGDRWVASRLKKQLAQAIQAKDLAFDQVQFLDEVPADASANPFLAIRVDQDGGFWTPVFATRHVTATLFYTQGTLVNRDAILAPRQGDSVVAFGGAPCSGECSEGRRTVTLDATTLGLVSLPHMRAHAAGKLAGEAAVLVADGLPEHLNPANWANRAYKLGQEKLGAGQGGSFSSFQRLAGCRGGVALVGTMDPRSPDWAVMYYDAAQDAITETLTRSAVQAKLPGAPPLRPHAIGVKENGVLALYVDDANSDITFPAACTLAGWQLINRK